MKPRVSRCRHLMCKHHSLAALIMYTEHLIFRSFLGKPFRQLAPYKQSVKGEVSDLLHYVQVRAGHARPNYLR